MLSIDDIERVFDVAEEYGFSVTMSDIEDIWSEYVGETGETELPFDSDKIADIFNKEVEDE